MKSLSYKFIKSKKGMQKNLIFIHGAGCNKKFFEPLAKQLNDFNCYLIDLPGHGDSMDSNPTKIEDYIDSVKEFILNLENVTLIGHSMGGTVTMGVASLNLPNVVSAIVLNSGAKFDFDKNFLNKIHKGNVDRMYLLKACGSFHKPIIYKQLSTFENNSVILKDTLICEKTNIENKLKNIKIPVLIMTGANEILMLVEHSKKIQSLISTSKLIVIPKTRHMLPIAESKKVSEHIKKFLD